MSKWWEPKYTVCSECQVHFEPVTSYDARWGHLCATHRKRVKERDEKQDAVVVWANTNWERLAPMMEKEVAKTRTAYEKAFEKMAHSQRPMQNVGSSPLSGLENPMQSIFPR